jgi:hypothetical protein
MIVTLLPAEDLSNAQLEPELRKRLESKSFSIDHIAVVNDTETVQAAK